MSKEKYLTDEEVEEQIAKLSDSDYVKLARKEARIKYKRRQKLYQLRVLEKRGKELMDSGITYENIDQVLFDDFDDDEI